MSNDRSLGEFEQIVLLAVLRLGDQAYGVTVLDEIAAKTVECPAFYVPVLMRETGRKGADDGEGQEAYT